MFCGSLFVERLDIDIWVYKRVLMDESSQFKAVEESCGFVSLELTSSFCPDNEAMSRLFKILLPQTSSAV
jgi:hypothetical protein